MGAYAPVPVVTEAMAQQIMDQIIRPTLAGLASEGISFKGVLYAGLMVTEEGPKVLEFNVRFGDPELQAILPLLKTDLVSILDEVVEGRLERTALDWTAGSCVCVVLTSGGYPGEFAIGKEIQGLALLRERQDVAVFHAGTKRERDQLVTWGGRVLNVVAWDVDLEAAVKKAYAAVSQVSFPGMHYRKDIAWRGLKKPVSR